MPDTRTPVAVRDPERRHGGGGPQHMVAIACGHAGCEGEPDIVEVRKQTGSDLAPTPEANVWTKGLGAMGEPVAVPLSQDVRLAGPGQLQACQLLDGVEHRPAVRDSPERTAATLEAAV